MPGFIGLPEILLLALVVLLVFGPKRLPEMGRSMGHGLREFKSSIAGEDKESLPLEPPLDVKESVEADGLPADFPRERKRVA
jgi:sec-independent protein translocase protein TatA